MRPGPAWPEEIGSPGGVNGSHGFRRAMACGWDGMCEQAGMMLVLAVGVLSQCSVAVWPAGRRAREGGACGEVNMAHTIFPVSMGLV